MYVHVFPEIHNTYMSDDTAVVFLYIERRKNVMNSLKLSILQDGVCLAWLLLDYYCSFHFPAVVRFNDCISTTRRNDISVVNVRRTSSSSSCKNCNCYNLNLQREFPFHAPSLFSKSWKASRILQYEPKINLKLFLPFPFNIRSLPSWGVYQKLD